MKKALLAPFLAALALLGVACPAPAQAPYPSRPIRLVVPFPPGGTADIFARLVGERIAVALGQPVVIENAGGAGGNVGAARVAAAEPDGYVLLMGTVGTHAINPTLYARMPYDALNDFTPVAYVAGAPNLMVVSPKTVRAGSVQAFVAEAKAKPAPFTMGSSGHGTSTHLSGEMFKQATGIDLVHVPFRGSAPAVTALIGGQIDVIFDTLPASIEHARAGSVRALAVTSAARSAALPDMPTLAESGLQGFEATSWFALFVPRGTPADIARRLNQEVARALAQPDLAQRFAEIGGETRAMTPEALTAFVRAEHEKWAKVVRSSGARID